MSGQNLGGLLVAGAEEAGDEPSEGRGSSPLDLEEEVQHVFPTTNLQRSSKHLISGCGLQTLRAPQKS